MKSNKQKVIIAGMIAIIIIITALVTFFYHPQKNVSAPVPIAIVNSVPSNDSAGVSVFDPIIINFNQQVDPLTISVTSNPTEKWTISQTTPISIRVNHDSYLSVSTTYTLTVLQHGSAIGTLMFETARDQNDPRQLQNLKSQLDKDYPLASLTPYETPSYRVVYIAPLTLEIDLIKSSTTSQDAISQVQLWVKSNGVEPATHKYVVVAPSPTP